MNNKVYIVRTTWGYYGPFETVGKAHEWADYYLSDFTIVIVHEPPQNKFEESK